MSSMVNGAYKNVDATNRKRGYQEPSVVTTPILDHRDGHYIRPNKVAFRYPNFKKNVNLNVHVRVFNFVEKTNAKTFEEYTINAFTYTLRDTTSNWCHNYMSEFLNCTFFRAYISILQIFSKDSK
jgi:hypothetical protein